MEHRVVIRASALDRAGYAMEMVLNAPRALSRSGTWNVELSGKPRRDRPESTEEVVWEGKEGCANEMTAISPAIDDCGGKCHSPREGR